jgi:hypothetical protein
MGPLRVALAQCEPEFISGVEYRGMSSSRHARIKGDSWRPRVAFRRSGERVG